MPFQSNPQKLAKVIKDYPKCLPGLRDVVSNELYWVRIYDNRLAIARWDGEVMSWEELQGVKNEIWGEDTIAVEYYPQQDNVVNKRNTRHLWWFTGILPFHEEFETN